MTIHYRQNHLKNRQSERTSLLTPVIIDEVKNYHAQFNDYSETPLTSLPRLANYLGVKNLFVKDESSRFNLNSFKVLGATYSIGKAIADKAGVNILEMPLKAMISKLEYPPILTATTDGNHGRGVAWLGNQLGLEVKIFMPKGTTDQRLKHILNLGAEGTITEMNYDDTVRWVAEKAKKENWMIIQDTAWEGYEDVPKWIMQGYSTIARELFEQLGEDIPTHIFLQAGVGAFAGVMADAFMVTYGVEKCPKIFLVEAEEAACYYQSALTGEKVTCTGDLTTIMAGLACGEANPIGEKILNNLCEGFFSAPDWTAANGMRILSSPLQDDPRIISGESGAVGVGLIEKLCCDPAYEQTRALIGVNEHSKLLVFSTEGDTDPSVYRAVTWYGNYTESK